MGAFVPPLTGHLDAALTQYAQQYRQLGLVSDVVFPRVGVSRKTDVYWIFGRESQQVLGSTIRAFGNPARRVRASLTDAHYNCVSHAEEVALPDESREDLPTAMLQGRTRFLMDRLLLDKEILAAAAIAAGVTGAHTQALSTDAATIHACWSEASVGVNGGQPGMAVEEGKAVMRLAGIEPNLLILGAATYGVLIQNHVVAEKFKYTVPGSLGIQQLQQYFDIPRIEVARGVKVDEAGAAAQVWGDIALLAYVQPAASMEDMSGGKTFVWEGAPGTIGGVGTVIGRDPQPSAKTELLSVDMYYDQKVTMADAYYLITNTVA